MKCVAAIFLIAFSTGCAQLGPPDPEIEIARAGSIINSCSTTNRTIALSVDRVRLRDVVKLTMKHHTVIRGRQSIAERIITADLEDVPPQRALIDILDQNGLCICSTEETSELIIVTKEQAERNGLEPLKTLWQP